MDKIKTRTAYDMGPGAPESTPKKTKREEALKSGAIHLEMDEEGGAKKEVYGADDMDYSREQRGELALEAALERGRQMRDAAAEKAAPLLAGLRSRISNFATRALSVLKTGFGLAGEAKDVVGNTWEAGKDVAKNMPRAMLEAGKFAYTDMVAETAQGLKDMALDAVAPVEVDVEAVGDLDSRILKINDALSVTRGVEARVALDGERQRLEAERDALLQLEAERDALLQQRKVRPGLVKAGKVAGAVASAPVTVPLAAGAALYAGGRAAKEAGGRAVDSGRAWVGEKLEQRAQEREERRREHEEACIARAELFLADAAEKSGVPVQKLGREQLFILGRKLEESLARRVAGGLKEVGKALTFYHDLFGEEDENGDKGLFANLKQGALSFADFARSPEDRAWLMSELQSANIQIGAALEDAFKTVGKKALVEPAVRGSRAAGRLGAKAVVGTVSVGAGLAMAGAEAAMNSGAGRAAKEAVIQKWEEHKPAVERGLASTVKELELFNGYAADVPEALEREVEKVAAEMNENYEKAVGFVARMQQRIETAMNITRNAWNEMRRTLVGEDLMAEDPETVAGIDQALEAMEGLEELPDWAIQPLDVTDAPAPRIRNRGTSVI